MSLSLRLSVSLITVLCTSMTAIAQTSPPSQPTALTNVRLLDDVDAPRVSILMREGHIVEVLDAGLELPGGYREIDGDGSLALPAFVDAHSTAGVSTPEPVATMDSMSPLAANVHVGMREANRKGLQPSLDTLTVIELADSELEGYRKQGFAALHSSPRGQILSGQSCVTSLANGALRGRVLANRVYMAAGLNASGSGYPSTLMGFLSHLRQFFLDARWQELRVQRYEAGRDDRRPPYDLELEAILPVLAKKQRLLCSADSVRDIRRWIKLSQEQDIEIAIQGGRDAWMVAAELAAAEIPVFLALDWGDEVEDPDAEEEGKEDDEGPEPDEEGANPEAEDGPTSEIAIEAIEVEADSPEEVAEAEEAEEEAPEPEDEVSWEYQEPLGVQRERRRKWEQRRDCAIRLDEAGVTVVFATSGQSPKDLLESARQLVELGLSEESALAALTTDVARVTGLERRLGKLEKGYDANIAIWTDSPFAKKASLEWLVIDGMTFEFEQEATAEMAPAEGVDLSGEWEVAYEDQTGAPAILDLEMSEDGAIVGTLSFEGPDGTGRSSEVTGHLSGHDLTLRASIEMGQFSAQIRIEGKVSGETITGDTTWKFSGGEDSNSFTAKRQPDWSESGHNHGGPNR
jgi:hypothetical protein